MTHRPNQLQRKWVWSAGLRLAHWGMALSVLTLLATAWLIAWAPSVAQAASDYHYIAGAFLLLSILLRIWLLLTDTGTAGWRALMLSQRAIKPILETLRFYVTLGSTPLPGWYAHNPLWIPIYGIVLLTLVALSLSGLLMEDHPIVFGIYLPSLHRALAPLIGIFTVAHILAVALHDTRAKHSDISGMLNGYRIFEIKGIQTQASEGVHKVSLHEISRPERKRED